MQEYNPEYFSGQGKLTIAEYVDGKPKNYRFVGNVPKLTLGIEVDKEEHKESHSGMRAVDKVIISEQNVEVSFTLEDVNAENLALAFGANLVDVAEKSVTDETSPTLSKGDNWILAHQNVSNVVIKDKAEQPLVVGVDYIVNEAFGRITYISDSKTLQLPFKANYTAGTAKKVEFLKRMGVEYALRFEGLNTANNNRPVLVEVHKMTLDPASSFDLINDEINQFEITGKALLANGELVTITKL